MRSGKAGQGRKLVDEAPDSFDGACNGFGAGTDHVQRSRIVGCSAVQMTLDALSGQGDWGKGILDFMSHPPRHFPPCRLLLRLEQVREIFKNEYVSGLLALVTQNRHRDRHVHGGTLQRHFHLAGGHAHAIGAAQQRLKILEHLGGEHIRQSGSLKNLRSGTTSTVGMKHPEQRLVGVRDAPVRIEGKHACRNAFQNRFRLAAALIKFGIGGAQVAAGSLDLKTAAFQFFGHAVERPHQVADLIGGTDVDAIVETSPRNFLCRLGQSCNRTRNQFRKKQCDPGSDKQHDHGEQQQ